MLWVRGWELLCIGIVSWVIQSRHAALLQLIHSLLQRCQLLWHLGCKIVLLARVFFDLRMDKNTQSIVAFSHFRAEPAVSLRPESTRSLSEGGRGPCKQHVLTLKRHGATAGAQSLSPPLGGGAGH